ncbi:MAG: YdhR family protein [Bryobacterales bacterium]|nr:YdhR family protein [Bryobacterales bacterium]
MHIQIVTFELNGLTQAQYEHACETQFAPAFRDVPGLLTKVWLSDPAANTYGGVYTWRDREAFQAYLASPLYQAVATHPNLANMVSREFSILEQPTRETRGIA